MSCSISFSSRLWNWELPASSRRTCTVTGGRFCSLTASVSTHFQKLTRTGSQMAPNSPPKKKKKKKGKRQPLRSESPAHIQALMLTAPLIFSSVFASWRVPALLATLHRPLGLISVRTRLPSLPLCAPTATAHASNSTVQRTCDALTMTLTPSSYSPTIFGQMTLSSFWGVFPMFSFDILHFCSKYYNKWEKWSHLLVAHPCFVYTHLSHTWVIIRQSWRWGPKIEHKCPALTHLTMT